MANEQLINDYALFIRAANAGFVLFSGDGIQYQLDAKRDTWTDPNPDFDDNGCPVLTDKLRVRLKKMLGEPVTRQEAFLAKAD